MELVGEEKKIQALFRELRLEDERITPRFVAVWPHAPARTPARLWSLNFSYTAIALVVVVSVLALALWSRSSRHAVPPNSMIGATPSVTPAPIAIEQPRNEVITGEPHRVSLHSRAAMFAARRRAELAARLAITRDAPLHTHGRTGARDSRNRCRHE